MMTTTRWTRAGRDSCAAQFAALRQAVSSVSGAGEAKPSNENGAPNLRKAAATPRDELARMNATMREDVASCFLPAPLADAARELGAEDLLRKQGRTLGS